MLDTFLSVSIQHRFKCLVTYAKIFPCTAKNSNSFVLQADSGAKIRLLICECFFMPELDFIMLIEALECGWVEN